MATLTLQTILLAGAVITPVAAAGGGDEFANASDERTYLQVTNGSGGSINVTIPAQQANVAVAGFGTLDLDDEVIAVANGATKLIGPFPSAKFNNASGRVEVEYSGVSSVTVAAVRLAR
jgi:precorrin-6B methylase 1